MHNVRLHWVGSADGMVGAMMFADDKRIRDLMMILGALFVIQHPIHEDYEYIRKCIESNWHEEEHFWSELRWLSICDALKKSSEIPEEVVQEAEWNLDAAHQLRRVTHTYGES